jgi:hypothetical protein
VYRDGGAIKAVLTLNRDKLSLECDVAFEKGDQAALEKLTRSA